ncbi:V-type ATPase 116kDa subunit family protein [Streptomyces sp. INA 01156]
MPATAERLAGAGASLVPLKAPRGADPPTLLRDDTSAIRRSFTPLVRTYGTVPYSDLDPTVPAGLVYAVMFGVMFGDAGHGALLLLAGLLPRAGRPRRAASLRPLWPFVAGAGLTSALAGLAYGEFFGPTGVLPVLWLNPLDEPIRLLAAAVVLGAVLLALAYGAGAVNRWRESGPSGALHAVSGIAGGALYLGLVVVAGAVWLGRSGYALAGAGIAITGLVLAGTGMYAATAGGPAASPRPVSSSSTPSYGSARTCCPSRGWPPSGSPMPRSATSCGAAPRRWRAEGLPHSWGPWRSSSSATA